MADVFCLRKSLENRLLTTNSISDIIEPIYGGAVYENGIKRRKKKGSDSKLR